MFAYHSCDWIFKKKNSYHAVFVPDLTKEYMLQPGDLPGNC